MWLKIVYNLNEIIKWPIKSNNIEVSLDSASVAPIPVDLRTFRISTVFPLLPEIQTKSIKNTTIYFFNFDNAYKVLGRIEQKGSDKLRKCVFFSNGLSSVLLISKEIVILEEFREIVKVKENALEKWEIKRSRISNIEFHINETPVNINDFQIIDYSTLPFVNFNSIIYHHFS